MKQEDGTLGIWPDNWDIVTAFCAISTQWRTEALGKGRVVYVGLDYTATEVGLRQAGFALSSEQWAGLQAMEVAAMQALNGQQG